MANRLCLDKLWSFERLVHSNQVVYVASAAIRTGGRGPWRFRHLPFPACRQLYQRFDYLYSFLRNVLFAAVFSCFPWDATVPGFKCFLFILSKTPKPHTQQILCSSSAPVGGQMLGSVLSCLCLCSKKLLLPLKILMVLLKKECFCSLIQSFSLLLSFKIYFHFTVTI